MTATSRPCRHPDAVFKLVDGEALIVVSGTEAEHLVLNEVGARIWELMDGERDVAAICSALTEEFDVDEARARQDVAELIDALADHGALAGAASPGSPS